MSKYYLLMTHWPLLGTLILGRYDILLVHAAEHTRWLHNEYARRFGPYAAITVRV